MPVPLARVDRQGGEPVYAQADAKGVKAIAAWPHGPGHRSSRAPAMVEPGQPLAKKRAGQGDRPLQFDDRRFREKLVGARGFEPPTPRSRTEPRSPEFKRKYAQPQLTPNDSLTSAHHPTGTNKTGQSHMPAHPNSSRRSCAIGRATASAIKRFLTRRCSRGSSGIDHSARLDSPMRSPGRVPSLSLPSIPGSIHRGRTRVLILIPKGMAEYQAHGASRLPPSSQGSAAIRRHSGSNGLAVILDGPPAAAHGAALACCRDDC